MPRDHHTLPLPNWSGAAPVVLTLIQTLNVLFDILFDPQPYIQTNAWQCQSQVDLLAVVTTYCRRDGLGNFA